MSVKFKKVEQKRPSVSLSRSIRESIGTVPEAYEHLICSHNTIKFQKKILPSLFITCICQPRNSCSIQNPLSSQLNSHTCLQNNQIQIYDSLSLEVNQSKLHVTKNSIKHIFTLEEEKKSLEEQKKFIMLRVEEKYNIIVNGYGLVNSNKKILITNQETLGDSEKIADQQCSVFEPQQLIQEAIRLRSQKLTSSSLSHRKLVFAPSASKTLTLVKQSCSKEKLPLQNKDSLKKQNLSASVGPKKFSDIDMKSSIRKTNICLAFPDKKFANKSNLSNSIKQIEKKKSVDKQNSRSTSIKILKEPAARSANNLKSAFIKQSTKNNQIKQQSHKNKSINTQGKPKTKNCQGQIHPPSFHSANKQNPIHKKIQKFNPMASFIEDKQNQVKVSSSKTNNKVLLKEEERNDSQISNSSFYTASKQQSPIRQITKKQEKSQQRKPLQNTEKIPNTDRNTKFLKFQHSKALKNEIFSQKSLNSSCLKKSLTYSKNQNPNSNQSKNFSKNISKSKIAKVSRALPTDKNYN